MRKAIILNVLFLFTYSLLFSQVESEKFFVGNVIADLSTFNDNDFVNPLPSILDSRHKIEIRFIKEDFLTPSRFIILAYDTSWIAKHYFYDDRTKFLFSMNIKQVNLNTLFSRLVAHNIFSLPNCDSLRTGNYYYYPKKNELKSSEITVFDGTCYFIEFKISDKFRRYHYWSPDVYSKHYSSSSELKNFTEIVEIFNTLMN